MMLHATLSKAPSLMFCFVLFVMQAHAFATPDPYENARCDRSLMSRMPCRPASSTSAPSAMTTMEAAATSIAATESADGDNDHENDNVPGDDGGGYIHEDDNISRQALLQGCFGKTSRSAMVRSGILDRIANTLGPDSQQKSCRILEIGCGAGVTTLGLVDWITQHIEADETINAALRALRSSTEMRSADANANARSEREPPIKIVAVDVNPALVESAEQGWIEYKRRASGYLSELIEVEFKCIAGEEVSKVCASQFDVVWMRFVVVHVSDPECLVRAAVACLKGTNIDEPTNTEQHDDDIDGDEAGIILIEDCDATGAVASPPWYVHELFHRGHTEASRKLGGDIRRGPHIGQYLLAAGITADNLFCSTFVPMFGHGVHLQGPISDGDDARTFERGVRLLRMSFDSLRSKFLEMELCSPAEIDKAEESLRMMEQEDTAPAHQIFSLPGGKVFQWWATMTAQEKIEVG